MKIYTEILLGDNGKEFDTGKVTRRPMELETLTLEEALERFDAGKRIYFIYQDHERYDYNCRKICKDRDYLIEHYNFYEEVCGK